MKYFLLKKNFVKRNSPPAAGRVSDIFRSAAVRSVGDFNTIGNEVSYRIKKAAVLAAGTILAVSFCACQSDKGGADESAPSRTQAGSALLETAAEYPSEASAAAAQKYTPQETATDTSLPETAQEYAPQETAADASQGTQGASVTAADASQETQGASVTAADADGFSFTDLSRLEFWFSSGAGGWATTLTVAADGSFSGEYLDGDMGASGEAYPNGTTYLCNFDGQFSQPVKVNDYTYSMRILELNYEKDAGTEEIRDGMRYIYSDAYGLEGAEDILIYLPDAPLSELPEALPSWGYYNLSDASGTKLSLYVLYNEAQQCGFAGYDIIAGLKEEIAAAEEWAAEIEADLQNEPYTQTEYNEKTLQLYELWDSELNAVWDVLERTSDSETMARLTEQEREWIAWKDQEILQAGAEYEGGSIQSMVMNQKAAELTRERVYTLLELIGQTPDGAD